MNALEKAEMKTQEAIAKLRDAIKSKAKPLGLARETGELIDSYSRALRSAENCHIGALIEDTHHTGEKHSRVSSRLYSVKKKDPRTSDLAAEPKILMTDSHMAAGAEIMQALLDNRDCRGSFYETYVPARCGNEEKTARP